MIQDIYSQTTFRYSCIVSGDIHA